jgi:hypothetical protein
MSANNGAAQKARRRSKYGNKGTTVDNIPFSSKKEALRYIELKHLQKSGEVLEFEMQPEYHLQEGFWKCCGEIHTTMKSKKHLCPRCGKKMLFIRPIHYVADFRVTYADGHVEIEDVKSNFMTEIFKIKWKMFDFKYPDLELKIVKTVRGAR